MKWFLLISAVVLAGQVAARADAGTAPADASGGVVTLPSEGGRSEAVPGVVVKLPGPPAAITAPEVPSVPPASDDQPPVLRHAARRYPPEFESDSALYCQTMIGQWTEADASALLGEASRQRLALGEDQSETGLILAFPDPTGHYNELELDFANETGVLRGVFAYPWNMTWQECRGLWGAHVIARKANQGRTFYSYQDRRLDVLADPAGTVISLGLY